MSKSKGGFTEIQKLIVELADESISDTQFVGRIEAAYRASISDNEILAEKTALRLGAQGAAQELVADARGFAEEEVLNSNISRNGGYEGRKLERTAVDIYINRLRGALENEIVKSSEIAVSALEQTLAAQLDVSGSVRTPLYDRGDLDELRRTAPEKDPHARG